MADTSDLPTRVISTIGEDTPHPGILLATDVASYPPPLIAPTIRLPAIHPDQHQLYRRIPSTATPPSGEYGLSPSGNNWLVPTQEILEYDGELDFLQPDWLKLAYPDGFTAGKAAGKSYEPFETIWHAPTRGSVEIDANNLATDRWSFLFKPLGVEMTEEEAEDYRRVHDAQRRRYVRDFIQGYLMGFSRAIRLVQHNDPGTPGSSWE